jgi:2-polyprenyl-3-methyl-5-hydroxy-6-metoxy-1,4-benzoquinol methylase
VARSLPQVAGASIDWRVGSAAQLPVADADIDVVLCAQTLQFLPEKETSLFEMQRVIKPGGRVALSLWCEIEDNPYFHLLTTTIARHIGSETAAGLEAAFALSAADKISSLLKTAGFEQIEMGTCQLKLPLPNLVEFVPRHISATPMAAGFDRATKAVQLSIVREVSGQLDRYTMNDRAYISFKSHMIILKT